MDECLHWFCRYCLKDYVVDLIRRGQIANLVCPHGNICKTLINEKIFKELGVEQEYIDKYSTFSLNQAIDKMADFGWCPSCSGIAELDLSKNFGTCTQCTFIFCLTCREKYHIFKQCPVLKVQFEQKLFE